MKFKGKTIGLVITDSKTHKEIGKINAQGVLVNSNGAVDITDPDLCLRLLTKLEKFEEFVCKKCGETFDSKGLLLAHHRKAHNDGK